MSKPAAIVEIERERAERKASGKAKHDAEIQRLADADSKRRAAEEAERKRQIEAADKRREEQYERELEEDSVRLFREGNPGASDAVWKSVRDEFRRLVIKRRAEEASNAPQHSLYQGWQP